MTKEQVSQIKTDWELFNGPGNAGRLAVLTADLKYTSLTMNATDAQLIDQLKWTGENVCNAYHVPPFMVGIGEIPRGVQVEAMLQMYYSQCIQSLVTNFEASLDEGLGLAAPVNGKQFGTAFDIDDLIWMDTATKTKAAADAIGAGAMSPTSPRAVFRLGQLSARHAMLQQQMFSLKALAKRDAENRFRNRRPRRRSARRGALDVPPPKLPRPSAGYSKAIAA
jgi:HK97 family phage portal protein